MKAWTQALTILCCLFVVVAEQSSTCPTCNQKPYNLETYEVAAKYAQLLPKIWNLNVSLTTLGTDYVNYIKGRNIYRDLVTALGGFFSSFYFNYFLPYLDQQPDACFMAAMINGTISCELNRNRTLIRDALNQLRDKYLYDISPGLEQTIALRAGCDSRCGEYPPDPEVNKTVCYENGFVYPIQQVLDLPRNRYLAAPFKALLLRLYNSDDFNDKFIAACATLAVVEVPFEIWNPNIIAEIIDLTTSSPIERECCYQRYNRAEGIRGIYDANVKSYITYMKQHYVLQRCN